jgi:hypothetical protein
MITKIALPIVAVLLILYVTVSILTSGGNALSEAMLYLAVLGLFIGILNPKAGMMFVFVCGNYLDFFKRFLAVSGSFSFSDVIKTLAVAPVATIGVFAGLMVNYSRQHETGLPKYRFILALFISGIVVGASMTGGQSMSTVMQSAANSALYVALIAFAGTLYQNVDAQHRLMRTLMLLFIPVVLYGWVQLEAGYNRIEVLYALSGLSSIVNPLIHPSLVEYKRVFSTMNSSVAYTLVGSILGVYALLFGFGKGFFPRFAGVVFAVVCLSSHIPGAGRTGWVVVIIAIFCYYIFRSSKLTLAAYVLAGGGTVFFLARAKQIGEWLVRNTQSLLGGSDFSERAINMGTFSSRTQGVHEWMTNPRLFSWFGLPQKELKAAGAHDMVGQLYTSVGVVGLSLALIFIIVSLVYLHRNLLRIRDRDASKLAAFFMANVFALLMGAVFSGSSLHVFPVNVYFWLMVGLLFQIIENDKQQRRELATNITSGSGSLSGSEATRPFRRGALLPA